METAVSETVTVTGAATVTGIMAEIVAGTAIVIRIVEETVTGTAIVTGIVEETVTGIVTVIGIVTETAVAVKKKRQHMKPSVVRKMGFPARRLFRPAL